MFFSFLPSVIFLRAHESIHRSCFSKLYSSNCISSICLFDVIRVSLKDVICSSVAFSRLDPDKHGFFKYSKIKSSRKRPTLVDFLSSRDTTSFVSSWTSGRYITRLDSVIYWSVFVLSRRDATKIEWMGEQKK